MMTQALSTLPREAKGRIAPPSTLAAPYQAVADTIATWPEVEVTMHWHFADADRIDGTDFYAGPDELGHIHLDGSIHLATPPQLGAALVAEGLARPFPWTPGWVMADIDQVGVKGAVALFRRNYDQMIRI